MPRTRIHTKTKDRFKRAVRDITKNLGRRIKVYSQSLKTPCPNCFYDKVTGSSTGKCKWKTPLEARNKQLEYENTTGKSDLRYKFFKVGRCPVCKNAGYLSTQRRQWVTCQVSWGADTFSNEAIFTPAGKGSYTSVQLRTDPKYLSLFRDCIKLEVDGVTCKVLTPPVIRGLGNQTTLVVVASSDNKISPRSSEILKDYN